MPFLGFGRHSLQGNPLPFAADAFKSIKTVEHFQAARASIIEKLRATAWYLHRIDPARYALPLSAIAELELLLADVDA